MRLWDKVVVVVVVLVITFDNVFERRRLVLLRMNLGCCERWVVGYVVNDVWLYIVR